MIKNIQIYLKFISAKLVTFFIPIKKNKYFCIAMTGNSYGDSIKCLSDYIAEHHPNPSIVWAFSDTFINKTVCEHVRVRMFSFRYYYHIMTSKFILSNVSLEKRMFAKRKGQICVQTWHGTALKRIGVDIYPKKQSLINRLTGGNTTMYNARLTDILVSGSKYMTDIYHTKCLYPKEIIHEVGTPRNDVFFHDTTNIRKKVFEQYNIDNTKGIILYAPTFRKGGTLDFYDVDLGKIKSYFEKMGKRDYAVMVRLHPNLIKKESIFTSMFSDGTINVSSYPDMIDLLCSADVLVTDYSSCMFDFMYSYKPVILYVPDRQTYNRGFYLNIDDLPFVVINNNTEIHNQLSALDIVSYKNRVAHFINEIGSVEDGKATETTYELMCKMSSIKK